MKMFSKSYIQKCNATKEFKDNPPSLEELFQKYKELPKNQNKTDLQIISNLRISMSTACCSSYLNTQTIHDLFLLAYMKDKYKVDWYSNRCEFK